jgi:hypothetical protein
MLVSEGVLSFGCRVVSMWRGLSCVDGRRGAVGVGMRLEKKVLCCRYESAIRRELREK